MCACVCVCAFQCVCICLCMYVRTHQRSCVCVHVCLPLRVFAPTVPSHLRREVGLANQSSHACTGRGGDVKINMLTRTHELMNFFKSGRRGAETEGFPSPALNLLQPPISVSHQSTEPHCQTPLRCH
ncbi:Hypothetical predicted protein [Xyrichtys novacula]|uniref:Secreted protein n=1 Tax=Xyrichtys novacula TaxID=13765 RepID=A0AAV1H9C2_XYRNO|nr:Hypothetical predicted protein [Xyrichtys novacula]